MIPEARRDEGQRDADVREMDSLGSGMVHGRLVLARFCYDYFTAQSFLVLLRFYLFTGVEFHYS